MGSTEVSFRSSTLVKLIPVLGALSGVLGATSVWAVQTQAPQSSRLRCGVLEKFAGDVQILSSDRSDLLPTDTQSVISCDDWLSVGQGWAIIRHSQGYLFHVAEGSFIQLQDPEGSVNPSKDQLLLFRGQVSVRSSKLLGEVRVVTANGRARIRNGAASVIFDSEKVETQLIALNQSATLENRFLAKRKITVKEGEATVLKLSSGRMVPSVPKAVVLTSLRKMLEDHQLGESFLKLALGAAQKRHDRKLAASLRDSAKTSRAPASAESAPAPAKKAVAPVSRKMQPTQLNRHFLNKVMGETGAGEEVLYPNGHSGRSPQGAKVQIINSEEGGGAGKSDTDSPEKARLIDQLGEIKPD